MEFTWTGKPSSWKDAPAYGIIALLGLAAFGLSYEWSFPVTRSGTIILAGMMTAGLMTFLRTHRTRYTIRQTTVTRHRNWPFPTVDQYALDQLRCLTVNSSISYLGTNKADIEFEPAHERPSPLIF